MRIYLITSCSVCCIFSAFAFTFNFYQNNKSTQSTIDSLILPEKNLIVNGDFEQGNVGFTSEYQYIDDTIFHGHYTVTSDVHKLNYKLTSQGDHTSGKGNYMAIDSKIYRVGHKSKFWISTPVKINPNTNYIFSTWAYHIGGKGSSSPTVTVTIDDQLIGPAFLISDQEEKWQHIYYKWNSGKKRGRISICMENIYLYQYVEDFAIDDICFGVH